MDENSQALYAKIQDLVKQEVQTVATQIFNKLSTQYGITKTQAHSHDGVTNPKILPTSVGFNAFSSAPGSVLAPDKLSNGQTFNNFTQKLPSILANYPIYNYPLCVIYGGGARGGFNGGNAPSGTSIFFDTGSFTTSGLWIKTDNGWYGFSPTSLI